MSKRLSYVSAKILNNKAYFAVALAGFTSYLLISISKHLHFGSTGYDLTIFDQAIRHYSRFEAPASSLRGYENLLGDHFHPILSLLAPFYWVFDDPITLLIAQAFLVTVASLPLYLYARDKTNKTSAVLLSIAFVFCPLLIRLVYFDFHEIAFAIPLIAFSIYLIEKDRELWALMPLGALLLVKENLSLLVVFFGVYLFLKNKRRIGVGVSAVGIGWFFLTTKFLIPLFAGGKSFNYWTYDRLGATLPEAILTMIKNPILVLHLLVTPPVKVATFIKSFGILFGASLLSPICILAIPLLLERFLSSNENYWQYNYHYGATLAPILFFAAVDTIYRIAHIRFFTVRTRKISYITFSALAAVTAVGIFVLTPMNFILKPTNYSLTSFDKTGYQTLSRLHQSTKRLCTTNHIAPHVGKYELQLIGFEQLPLSKLKCDTIVVSDELDGSDLLTRDLLFAKQQGFTESYREDSWVIYKR